LASADGGQAPGAEWALYSTFDVRTVRDACDQSRVAVAHYIPRNTWPYLLANGVRIVNGLAFLKIFRECNEDAEFAPRV